LSALYTRFSNRQTAGLYPIRAFANTRYTNFLTVPIIDAMGRGRSCWRLRMGVEGRGIGKGEAEFRGSDVSKTAKGAAARTQM
jgi:hypothetical protein